MQMLAPRHIYTSCMYVCMCVCVYTFYVFVHRHEKCRNMSMVLIDGLHIFCCFHTVSEFNLLSQCFWTICTFCKAQKVWIHQSLHACMLHAIHVVYAAQKHVIVYIGQKNCRYITSNWQRVCKQCAACACEVSYGHVRVCMCAEYVQRIIGGEVTSPLLCSLSLSGWFVYSQDNNTHLSSQVKTFLEGRLGCLWLSSQCLHWP